MIMRKLTMALATCGMLTVGSYASAATNWSGNYFGVNVGTNSVYYSIYDVDYDWFGGTMSAEKTGGAIGVVFGRNFQSGSFVYGFEGDVSVPFGSKWEERYSNNVNLEMELNYAATIRGRAGMAVDNTIVYFTGGLAVGSFDGSWLEDGDPADSWPDLGKTAFGLVSGVGIEHAISNKNTLRLEFINTNYSAWWSTNQNGFRYQMNPSTTEVRVGWNMKF